MEAALSLDSAKEEERQVFRTIVQSLCDSGWPEDKIQSAFEQGYLDIPGDLAAELVAEETVNFHQERGISVESTGNGGENEYFGENGENGEFDISKMEDWIEYQTSYFFTRDIYTEFSIRDAVDKQAVRSRLKYLVKIGKLERGERTGQFRKVDDGDDILDLSGPVNEGENIILPLGLNEIVNIPQGGVILVAGQRNAGKTGFLLNVAADNMHDWKVTFMNSESVVDQLKKRLARFEDTSLPHDSIVPKDEFTKNVKFIKRHCNFHDRIDSDPKALWIIDYLTVYQDHWQLPGLISKIFHKMGGKGIAVIAMQKPKGRDFATGGEATKDIPCLYLSMGSDELKLEKVKDFKGTRNPEGQVRKFKLVGGCVFMPQDQWSYPNDTGEDDLPWEN